MQLKDLNGIKTYATGGARNPKEAEIAAEYEQLRGFAEIKCNKDRIRNSGLLISEIY